MLPCINLTCAPLATGADNKTCKTVAVSNELDGMRVVRSTNVNDTVIVLARITHAIARMYANRRANAPGSTAAGTAHRNNTAHHALLCWGACAGATYFSAWAAIECCVVRRLAATDVSSSS